MVKYVFLPTPAYGHVNPTLAVAHELISLGEQVMYYLTEEFQAAVDATGATFQAYQSAISKEQPSYRLSENLIAILRAMPLTIVRESQHVIPQVLERLRGK